MARMERYVNLSLCGDVSSFNTVSCFASAKYGGLAGGGRKGRKPRKEDGRAFKVSVFRLFWTISKLLSTGRVSLLQNVFGVRCVSPGLGADGFSRPARGCCCTDRCELDFQLYSRSTVGRGNYANNMWNPFGGVVGVPVAFHRLYGLKTTDCRFVQCAMTPLD